MKRWGVVAILLLAFLGLADDFYLAQHEASGAPLLCTVQNLTECNTVVNSKYSHIFGISAANLGVAFFGFIFVIAALELVLFDRILRRVLQAVSLVGVGASLVFAGIQVFIIHALCIYCLTSGALSLLVGLFATCLEPLRPHALSGITGTSKERLQMPPA